MGNLQVLVISLERTPGRLESFRRRNEKILDNFELVKGIDGELDWNLIKNSKLISEKAKLNWSKGAIGSALSHLTCWKHCLSKGRNTLILEDDVLLSEHWEKAIKTVMQDLEKTLDLLLLGWNVDSILRAEIFPGLNCTSLFDPSYPSESTLKKILDVGNKRRLCKLYNAFGLPGYVITPQGAKKLLNKLIPLRCEQIKIGRGVPELDSKTLDSQMNFYYEKINAWVLYGPIALAMNDPEGSLTDRRNRPTKFR